MPRTSLTLTANGSIKHTADGPLFVLAERLEGHDTFLTGNLDLDGHKERLRVRILTFDDVTVLHPTSALPDALGERWSGTLRLPHGLRPRVVPRDLEAAAHARGRRLDALDTAETRYALTFLAEATTDQIRAARVDAIVQALPSRDGGGA
ncbi:hypothetical protein ACIBFB_06290 [Nocardiopsis sp. NPDC050513]|uniref:hypothetical protein n=1 Tax=Nocardiopsis sp. NPDC050513 TaxID=3364338 RepID=UPI0037B1F0EF